MTLFRILCVPFIMWCTIDPDTYIDVGQYEFPIIGLIILVVAAASDFNPGSCCTYSVPLLIALCCIYMKLSVEETISALTINGAAACGREALVGSIEVGKRADFLIFDCKELKCLPYYTGINLVKSVFIEGEKVYGEAV